MRGVQGSGAATAGRGTGGCGRRVEVLGNCTVEVTVRKVHAEESGSATGGRRAEKIVSTLLVYLLFLSGSAFLPGPFVFGFSSAACCSGYPRECTYYPRPVNDR